MRITRPPSSSHFPAPLPSSHSLLLQLIMAVLMNPPPRIALSISLTDGTDGKKQKKKEKKKRKMVHSNAARLRVMRGNHTSIYRWRQNWRRGRDDEGSGGREASEHRKANLQAAPLNFQGAAALEQIEVEIMKK